MNQLGGITQRDLIKQVYELQKESCERDARIETSIKYINEKITDHDEQLRDVVTLLQQNQNNAVRFDGLFSQLENYNMAIEQNNMRIAALEKQPLQAAEQKKTIENHEIRIVQLEQRPAQNALKFTNKIISLLITGVVSSIVGWLIGFFSGR